MESDLLARKLPPNGIQELMSHVQEKMVWAKSLVEADFTSSDSTYKLFVKLMHTSIYTESNNGKCSYSFYILYSILYIIFNNIK